MTLCFDFAIDWPGLEDAHVLLCRPGLDLNGDLETGFLSNLDGLRRHPARTGLPGALASVLAERQATSLIVIRNPDLVLDASLANRLADALSTLPPSEEWSLAAAGGLGPHDRRHLALYATQTPAIPDATGRHPLIDAMPDLVILNAAFAREVMAAAPALPDAALEPVICAEGYLAGRVALYLHGLGAGVDGGLMARDIGRLERELTRHFASRLAGQTIETLAGPVTIRADEQGPSSPGTDLAQQIDATIERHCDPLSLSVIVRTRFDRDHLLRRLLTSLSRARRSGAALEIILSTDVDADICESATAALQNDFRNLAIRACRNRPGRHSRVANMLGGIAAGRNEYVMLIDDDDYVDLFAFDTVAPALFAGNRPLIVTNSEVHDEAWEQTPGGRWVLTRALPRGGHPATGWRDMFTGVNRLPVSALLIPRAQLVERLEAFEFVHDLSEDYALFLLLLTDPNLPAIHEAPGTFCHISVRGTENSITMPDRRPWARDIAGYLSDLARDRGVAGAGKWQLLTHPGDAAAVAGQTAIADLRAELDRARTSLRLLGTENAQLRRQLSEQSGVIA